NDVTLKMPAFEWVHVQLHQQKGMISLSPPTICNSALFCMFFKLLVDSVRYTKYPLLVTGKTVIGRRNPRSHRRRRS
ncbi:hypothetical protein N7262_24930, partial [Escherichia coli]|uniref:hypothetical protein n=1 Tax=Escherichia coli TaxID=562 RepID=UPI0021BF80C5